MDPEKTGTIRVTDSELYYESYGNGHPLILIHGGWTNRRVWQPQLEAFSKEHRVILYDVRGHGQSTVGELPYSHVDDLTHLMDRLAIGKAILVGHEQGGSIARAMGIERPERVEALILVAAGNVGLFGVPMPDEETERYGRPIKAVQNDDLETAVEEHEAIWVNGLDHEVETEICQAIRDIAASENFPEYRPGAPEIMWSSHMLSELRLVHLPVLLIWGLNDQPLIERTALMSADALPDVHTASFPDAAHYINWEKSTEFNETVLHFLSDRI